MTRRLAVLVVVPFVGLLVGCGQVQDAATESASQAASQVGKASAEELKRQICSRVQDGQVSAQDKQVLSGLVSVARSAGVPDEVTTPLDQIARAGDQVPAESLAALRKACGPTSSSS